MRTPDGPRLEPTIEYSFDVVTTIGVPEISPVMLLIDRPVGSCGAGKDVT